MGYLFLYKWIFIVNMLKSIPQYNYTIRPFKAYKSWSFISGSDVVLLNAEDTTIFYSSNSISLPNGFIYNKHESFFYLLVRNPKIKFNP